MTYSVESLVFRAVAGVVNTAARAANGLLEVMYPPRYDVAHIWDELAAPCADPHPAGAADPAAETVNPPDLSAAGSPLNLPWEVIDLTDPPYDDGLTGLPWGIADRWGVIIGRFGTETQAYAVVEAVSGLVGGPLLW